MSYSKYDLEQQDELLAIILTIITFGIYGIFWRAKLVRSINALSEGELSWSPLLVILVSFLTCGIFMVYWDYKAGTIIERTSDNDNEAILYVLFDIFGFGIVTCAIMQSRINRIIENN